MAGRSGRSPVYSITGAQRPLSDDVDDRARRYLISMGIRTACFIGAIVAHGPLRWVLAAAAIVLPYVSVVVANAGRERIPDDIATTVLHLDRPALGPGPSAAPADPENASPSDRPTPPPPDVPTP